MRPENPKRELAEPALTLRRERYLRRRLAAKYLEEECGFRCTVKQLAKLACAGGGPKMQYRNGLPYYRTDCLLAWAEDGFGPPVTSTSAIKRSRHPAFKSTSEMLPNKAITRHAGVKSASRRRTSTAPEAIPQP
jgi:hypothetical protein